MSKHNVSTIDLSLLEERTYISKIDLKCRDFKLFEQFMDISITNQDRSMLLEELNRRDPLLLNELFNNTISSFIEHQTSILKRNIYYLIDNEKIDFPKKIQLLEILCLYDKDYLSVFQSIIQLFFKVCSYDAVQQCSSNVSTTLLFDTIKQIFIKDVFKTIESSIYNQIFDVIQCILDNTIFNEDFKYKLFHSIRQEEK